MANLYMGMNGVHANGGRAIVSDSYALVHEYIFSLIICRICSLSMIAGV